MTTKIKKQKKQKRKSKQFHGDFRPLKISGGFTELDEHENWLEVSRQLAKPKRGRALFKRLGGGKKSPVSWMLSQDTRDEATEKQINRWYRQIKTSVAGSSKKHCDAEQLANALAEVNSRPIGPALPLIALGSAHVINSVADQGVTYSGWASVVTQLLDLSHTSEFGSSNGPIAPWLKQTLNVELPLSLAYQLPEFVSPNLASLAVEGMASDIAEVLDHDGWPDESCLQIFGPLVASWARSVAIMRGLGLELPPDAAIQVEWSVRQLMRLLRHDRSVMFGGPTANRLTEECLKLVLKLSSDSDDKMLVKRLLGQSAKSKAVQYLPRESSISEWSESGVLQSGWYRGSPKVVFDYAKQSFRLEIGAGKTLICGEAMPQIRFDGRSAMPLDGFEVVCNEHDDDLDYVELQMDLAESLTFTRQIILSRDEQFLLVADCVVPKIPGQIEYQCDWPLAPGITVMPESETREVYLRTDKIQSLVLPLALPEWKVERFDGRFEFSDDVLQMTHTADGAGLYSPLFFDLNPRRSKNKRTWRRLTVAENLQRVTPDVAAAFRIQVHKQQWFFYRVVSARGNRTFLGENFNGEFVLNRFDRDGKVTQLVGIE